METQSLTQHNPVEVEGNLKLLVLTPTDTNQHQQHLPVIIHPWCHFHDTVKIVLNILAGIYVSVQKLLKPFKNLKQQHVDYCRKTFAVSS